MAYTVNVTQMGLLHYALSASVVVSVSVAADHFFQPLNKAATCSYHFAWGPNQSQYLANVGVA